MLSLFKHGIRFFLVCIGEVWCYDLDVLPKGLCKQHFLHCSRAAVMKEFNTSKTNKDRATKKEKVLNFQFKIPK